MEKIKISTADFSQRFQYHIRNPTENFDTIEKKNLLENKQLLVFKKYIVGDWKTLVIKKHLFFKNEQDYQKSIEIGYLTHGVDSIIFSKCTFDCDIVIQNQGDKLRFVFFIDCEVNKKLSISGKIEDYLIIHNSKINDELVFESNSYVKKQILLNKSTFKLVNGINDFVCDKLFIEDCKISENLILNSTKISSLIIKESQIKGNFENNRGEVQVGDFRQSLSFIKTSIRGNIELQNARTNDILFNEISANGHINIGVIGKNIILEGESNNFKYISVLGKFDNFQVRNTRIEGQIIVSENSEIGYFIISNAIINEDIFVKKSGVNVFTIQENSLLKALNCNDVTFSTIEITNVKFKGYLIINSTFTETINIYNCQIDDSFTFSSLRKDKGKTSLYYQDLFLESVLRISGTDFSHFDLVNIICNVVSLDKIKVDDFSISKILCRQHFAIHEKGEFDNFSINQVLATRLIFDNIDVKSNKIAFSECYFNKIKPFDFPKYEYIFDNCKILDFDFSEKTNPKDNIYTFIKCNFSKLTFSNFNNLGNIFFRTIHPIKKNLQTSFFWDNLLKENQFENLEEFDVLREYKEHINPKDSPSVTFNQSSLGKAEFTDFNFVGFDFYYNNSKITETFISGGTLPKTIEIYNIDKDEKPTEYYTQKVGAYNQFKKVFESQGDNFQSTYFQAKAAENQAILLEEQINMLISEGQKNTQYWIKKKWVLIKVFLSHNAFERLTFWLNKKSNKHGESWGQALKFTFCGSILLFNLYILLNPNYYYTKHFFIGDFEKIVGDYISFLDPTQKINEKINGWGKLIIFLSKILIGYGIFQLIAAFRKHGKKSN